MSILSAEDGVPIWTIAWSREEFDRPDLPVLTVISESGVQVRDFSAGGRAVSEDLSGYRVVHPGDLVVNRLWARFGAYGISSVDGIISPAYWVLQLDHDKIYPQFAHYLLRSSLYLAEIGRISKNLPPNGFDLPWEQFRKMHIQDPPLAEQRAIADFLDAETVRIGALIEKKRRMHSAIEERFKSERDQWVQRLIANHGNTTVRRWVDGIEQGWSPSCENREADADKWGVLKTSAVTQGVFKEIENKRLPEDLQPNLRWVVKDGDVLVARGSGSIKRVGTAAVADTGGRKLMISDLIYRLVRPRMNSALLAQCINSSIGRTHLESSIRTDVGQTLKIRGDDLLDTPVPWVPPELQVEALDEIERRRCVAKETVELLSAQIELLTEHRQALITAAVTGQLNVAVS